jgi:hypothetical protein
MPVEEASSSSDSPAPDMTESPEGSIHQSDNSLVGVPVASPTIRDFWQEKQGEEVEQEQQQTLTATQPAKDEEWPSTILTYSSTDSDDAVGIPGVPSLLVSIDSPSSATPISPNSLTTEVLASHALVS